MTLQYIHTIQHLNIVLLEFKGYYRWCMSMHIIKYLVYSAPSKKNSCDIMLCIEILFKITTSHHPAAAIIGICYIGIK